GPKNHLKRVPRFLQGFVESNPSPSEASYRRCRGIFEHPVKEGLEKGREEGIEEGLEKGLLSVAHAALERGLPIEEIMALTGLPREKIQSLTAGE
ncbi:MAG: hypothetical protein FWF12_08895, partial [Betaproteobacteria bacterium]|nr:hypothetical protein [Betaproteobacteria bacterium]